MVAGDLQFRVGAFDVCVRGADDAVRADLAGLYHGVLNRPSVRHAPLDLSVARCRWPLAVGPRYQLWADGERLFEPCTRAELVPYIEWGINRRLMQLGGAFLQLHAASLAFAGQGFVFAGDSGVGKSTLAALLRERGWTYLCDEFALLDPGDLRLHAFPKALCLKASALELAARRGMPLWQRRYHVRYFNTEVGYLYPPEDAARPIEPVPVRHVIFPRYRVGVAARLEPISRGQATFALMHCLLNGRHHGPRAASFASHLARRVRCYRLTCGAPEATCTLLEQLS